ncbi:HNH endonuclease [Petroclostridium xylanilyticum]|uniref:HNH endonuclease n=1 Tax=Petroclostridium xylanilyticum TaxID=1792311 RepID=UPI0018E36649|nr:HNH endonuclease [Petroclostridium xylanilyticum]
MCGFDFKEFYGDIGIGYIEVHHIKPLNEISKEYIVDTVNDLRPICPNCHSMLHKANISVENLRDIVEKNHRKLF